MSTVLYSTDFFWLFTFSGKENSAGWGRGASGREFREKKKKKHARVAEKQAITANKF